MLSIYGISERKNFFQLIYSFSKHWVSPVYIMFTYIVYKVLTPRLYHLFIVCLLYTKAPMLGTEVQKDEERVPFFDVFTTH